MSEACRAKHRHFQAGAPGGASEPASCRKGRRHERGANQLALARPPPPGDLERRGRLLRARGVPPHLARRRRPDGRGAHGTVRRSAEHLRHAATGRLRGHAGARRHSHRPVRPPPDAARRHPDHGVGAIAVLVGAELPAGAAGPRPARRRRRDDLHLRPAPGRRMVPGPPLPDDGRADQPGRNARQRRGHRAAHPDARRPGLGSDVRHRRRPVHRLRPAAAASGGRRALPGGGERDGSGGRQGGAGAGQACLDAAGRSVGFLDPPVVDGRSDRVRRAVGLPLPDPGSGLLAGHRVVHADAAGRRRPDSATCCSARSSPGARTSAGGWR